MATFVELTATDFPAGMEGQRLIFNLDNLDVMGPFEGGGTALWRQGWEAPLVVAEPYWYVRGAADAQLLPVEGVADSRPPRAAAPVRRLRAVKPADDGSF
jgi:hypothetical protein